MNDFKGEYVMLKDTIKAIRMINRVGNRELSLKLHYTQPYISQIENGTRKITPEVLEGYSSEFNIPVYKILEISNDQDINNYDYKELLMEILVYYISKKEELGEPSKVMKKINNKFTQK